MTSSRSRPKSRSIMKVGRNRSHHRSLWSTDDDVRSIQALQRDLDRVPMLTHEEQQQLARQAQLGDERARQRLLTSNIRLLISAAHDFIGMGMPVLDLVSEGMLGMSRALELFDPDRGPHFTTYAIWWIKQKMIRAIMESKQLVRVPTSMQHRLRQLTKMEDALLTANGSVSTDDLRTLCQEREELLFLWRTCLRPALSFDRPVRPHEKLTLGETIVGQDETSVNPELWQAALVASQQTVTEFTARWKKLRRVSPRDKTVLVQRFGLNGGFVQNLASIGKSLHLTKERIRQIEQKVLSRLFPRLTVHEARAEMGKVRYAIETYQRFAGSAAHLSFN